MNVTNELQHLESYIADEYEKQVSTTDRESAGKWRNEFYDKFQYAGNIVPRLYLLVTVGSVSLKVDVSHFTIL